MTERSHRGPTRPPSRRDMLRATLDHAATAEHTTQFTRPVTGDLFAAAGPPAS